MALDFATDVELHSFHWTNFNREVLAAHKRVMQHFNLNVQYTEANVPHGEWLDWVMGRAQCKIVGIIEPDLIPLSRQIVLNSINLAYQMNSLWAVRKCLIIFRLRLIFLLRLRFSLFLRIVISAWASRLF